MKKIFSIVALQALIINFGIILINGVIFGIEYLCGNHVMVDSIFLISSIIISVLSALLSIVFYVKPFKNMNNYLLIFIHFVFLTGIITLAGFLFDWCSDFKSLMLVYMVYIPIYAAVWIITLVKQKQTEDLVNKALKANQDEE